MLHVVAKPQEVKQHWGRWDTSPRPTHQEFICQSPKRPGSFHCRRLPKIGKECSSITFLGWGLLHCMAYGMWDLITLTLTRSGIEYGPSVVKVQSPLDCHKIPPQGPLSNLQLLTYTFTAHSSSSRSSKEQGLCLLTSVLNFLVAQRCSSWYFEYKYI